MELFTVLAELDGTGTPLAYCLVDKQNVQPDAYQRRRADPGAMLFILSKFLIKLKGLGFDPSFIATDKDPAEIGAVKLVWPGAKHQLCYWHAKRALSMKLKDSTKTATLA